MADYNPAAGEGSRTGRTNFGQLLDHQKKTWGKDVWRNVRQQSFIMNRTGSDLNSAIQRITELSRTEKGTKAIITMVPDLEGDGIVGDSTLEGNEEKMVAYDQEVVVDQLRNANVSEGRMAEQETIVNFREQSRDLLSFWMADRVDQIAALVAAGQDLRLHTNGALRKGFEYDPDAEDEIKRDTGKVPMGQALCDLDFASKIEAPSDNRHFRYDKDTGTLKQGEVGAITPDDKISYEALVDLRAFAKDRRVKSLRTGNGEEVYHLFVHPKTMAALKKDDDFLANVRHAGQRGDNNVLFSGAIPTVDGLVLHEFTHSFNTLRAKKGDSSGHAGAPGYKWGGNGDVDGNRIVLMGAQALGFADIGIPEWDEDVFDYNSRPGIAISKIMGFHKPRFYNPWEQSTEDFGIICLDVAI